MLIKCREGVKLETKTRSVSRNFFRQAYLKHNCLFDTLALHAGIFFLIFCHQLTFFKIKFFEKLIVNTSASNSLDPDQTRHFVRPDLGPNCLQK